MKNRCRGTVCVNTSLGMEPLCPLYNNKYTDLIRRKKK